ncbi:MAG: HPr family phosphocarrier protein [Oscillospiraceae bacterium]|nr:HPr family phosphocarrier protein [Oscillospiraceae bacterium]
MVKQVNIKSFQQVRNIVDVASQCYDDIGVHDEHGAIADAKSILGLMSLDYTKPVKLVSENAHIIDELVSVIS